MDVKTLCRCFLVSVVYLITEHWSDGSSHFGDFPDGVGTFVLRTECEKHEPGWKCYLGQVGHDSWVAEATEHEQRTSNKIHLTMRSSRTTSIGSACWRSSLSRRHPRSIWASTSRCAPAHATLDRRPSHCCPCHFDRHHLPDDRSALPHLWVGTHCHLPY